MPKPRAPSPRHDGLHIKLPVTAPGQAIGLLGGSFNPVHEGHVNISRAALKRLGLDQLWWVMSPGNPLKSHDELLPLDERMAAARAMVTDRRIIVTDFERHLPTPYTASTLAFLTARQPRVHFVWLMGADNLAQIHLWKNWEQIFERAPVAVLDRPGYRHRAMAARAAQTMRDHYIDESDASGLAHFAPPAWTFLTIPLTDISSTDLRER